ncbi:zinc-dependent metalloprotease [Agriterribacter sp.]|uniref:zinc-dependent metalloprotease n=1 Tax=Agriterribacter sp. TaxID=2821509 RepID=UPI002BFF77BE|nr:zinc-dependent metalloprotease [Agriterribacter sp.]HTN07197.1 zinc-dependent metalloprotease [Agriterribacter sp.]
MYRKAFLLALSCCFISIAVLAQKKQKKKDAAVAVVAVDTTKKSPPKSPKPTIAEKIKSSKKTDGLFTIYQDTATGSIQLYIKKDQLGKEYIYQSFSMGGPTRLYLNQNMIRATFVFSIAKPFDKLEFAQQNTNFYYDPSNAVSKAANVDAPPAIFFSEKVAAEDSTGYLIAADGLFISDKLDPVKPTVPPGVPPTAVFNLGMLNVAKSKYNQIRSYPDNTDVVVDLAYDNPTPFNRGGDDVTDARYNRVRMQHSFLAMPENDYRPRRDDPRVGYFGAEVQDLTSTSATPYKDFISRWNLVKKDPAAAVSEPVEPVVYWIENTTPVEYRNIIKGAGEKWNEAFEKAGFKNAIVMKIMPDTATWDPADIRYNVIRWVSSPFPSYGAIGPSFFNPRTGQILGADITVEWRSGAGTVNYDDLFNGSNGTELPAVQLPWTDASDEPHVSFDKHHLQYCTIARELQAQYITGLTVLEALDNRPEEVKEMHKEFLIYLIMHEMGHTLGLNHNMKASQMLSPAQVNDKSITDKIGMIGSVMDYPAINVSLDRSKQGNYYTTKAGPYDIWAIEYGYTPFAAGEEEAALNKILSRSTDPQLAFGNDADDMRSPGGGIDPRVMINDMSNDMMAYAEDRFKLVNKMMPQLKERYSKPGQSYQQLRQRYLMLQSQRAQMANAVSRYIGGVYVDRSFAGQNTTAKPFTPVSPETQKKALALLNKYIFSPNVFNADAVLFPYLQQQRRGFNFFGSTEDYKPQSTVQSIQLSVLAQLLHPVTLQRINNSGLYGNTYSTANLTSDLNKYFFTDDLQTNVNLYRINLQTEYVKALAAIAASPMPNAYDNASKAAALSSLKKIKAMLATAVSANEQTRAHRINLNFIIDKALSVK